MKPDISEFSYGYALTEELINHSGLKIKAAPLFPSLIDEGRSGGFDVAIPFDGFPLFLQFKLSHCMIKSSASEAKGGIFTTPFYRMHLRPLKHSQQHNLLLKLESKGHAVFYAAPYFHLPEELNDAYIAKQVKDRSIFIKPSEIGALPDDEDHHIAFKTGSGMYFCSKPKLIRDKSNNSNIFNNELLEGYFSRPRLSRDRESLITLSETLFECLEEVRSEISWVSDENIHKIRQRTEKIQISYLARAFFGCEIILIAPLD